MYRPLTHDCLGRDRGPASLRGAAGKTKPASRQARIESDAKVLCRAGDHTVQKVRVIPAALDAESAEWLRALDEAGARREAGLARLHERLVRMARREVARRGMLLAVTGPELEDVAYQAAADALVAITRKLGQFRGESRFMTWACKFVIFEVSAKIRRHFWPHPPPPLAPPAL